MSHFQITGGVRLQGEVRSSGAKNAALPIMAAAILASEPVRLENVPRLADVETLTRVLRRLGMAVAQVDDGMTLETVDPAPVRAPQRLVRQMRASFCTLGPLLARRGRAVVPLPGGCNIGHRPVDLHLKGLAALGADLQLKHGYVVAAARRLTGTTIDLAGPNGPTVTGTANVMCAAVLARGETVIHHAAIEPEIVDLGKFLAALGARIEGLGTPTMQIKGVEQLGGAAHRLIPDRIETATLLLAAAITGGSATVVDVVPEHLGQVLDKLQAAGAHVEAQSDRVSIRADRPLRAVDILAAPYPGIPTDIQAQWTALACRSEGTSRVQDGVFPGRFLHVAELGRLGARIVQHGDTAVVSGVARLSGATVVAGDLRASAALVLAGLAAEGRTIVEHIHHLDRGYERLDEKLRQLGARIERMTDQPSNSAIPSRVAALFSASSRLASGQPERKASSR
jgi:UDP-N-acetylglucosamine 1-carboxyvinyltransferase